MTQHCYAGAGAGPAGTVTHDRSTHRPFLQRLAGATPPGEARVNEPNGRPLRVTSSCCSLSDAQQKFDRGAERQPCPYSRQVHERGLYNRQLTARNRKSTFDPTRRTPKHGDSKAGHFLRTSCSQYIVSIVLTSTFQALAICIASLGRLPLFAASHGDERSRPSATMRPHTSSDK